MNQEQREREIKLLGGEDEQEQHKGAGQKGCKLRKLRRRLARRQKWAARGIAGPGEWDEEG